MQNFLKTKLPHQDSSKSTVFLTSDEHYLHKKIVQYSERPFPDMETMEKEIIQRSNSVVRPTDHLIHIGDICFGTREDLIRILESLNGIHYLMDGSHDRALGKLKKEPLPESLKDRVHFLPKLFEFKFNGRKISLLHYAMTKWWCSHHGSVHFFGHSHNHHHPNNRSIDVGVDAQNFYPIRLNDAIGIAEKKQVFHNHPPRTPN